MSKPMFSTPGAEGMDEAVLGGLDEYIRKRQYPLVNSVLCMRNGRIVLEKYFNGFDESSRNNIKSVWKSILSAAAGICLDRRLIGSPDDPVGHYLPEFGGAAHSYHRHMTVRHLLTMTSGIYWTPGVHYHCPLLLQLFRENDWTGFLADTAMSAMPGTKFQYKEWDVILLSAVIGRAAGMNAYEFTKMHLYEPLGIQSGVWPHNAQGISHNILEGQEDSDLCARDMAKLGQLFLQGGIWDGKQILSDRYISGAVSPSPANPGYGFLWWLNPDGFSARGFGGQEINVVPEKNFVSVVQATPTLRSKHYSDIQENVLKRAIR